MIATFKTLPALFAALPTEQAAIDHFTAIRWANGKFCPLCGNADAARIGTLTGTNTHRYASLFIWFIASIAVRRASVLMWSRTRRRGSLGVRG